MCAITLLLQPEVWNTDLGELTYELTFLIEVRSPANQRIPSQHLAEANASP